MSAQRREKIINLINQSTTPISGTYLSEQLNVSRQIIVQDIALIRASGIKITSTNKGYIITNDFIRVFKVKHSNEQIEDELTTIIDLGGKVIDCFVVHDVYGEINVSLNIKSRKDINNFISQKNTDKPLMQITNDIHFHTVIADDVNTLDLIENSLKKQGFIQ